MQHPDLHCALDVLRLPPTESEKATVVLRAAVFAKVQGCCKRLRGGYGGSGDGLEKQVGKGRAHILKKPLSRHLWHQVLKKEHGFFDMGFLEVKVEVWFADKDPSAGDDE